MSIIDKLILLGAVFIGACFCAFMAGYHLGKSRAYADAARRLRGEYHVEPSQPWPHK